MSDYIAPPSDPYAPLPDEGEAPPAYDEIAFEWAASAPPAAAFIDVESNAYEQPVRKESMAGADQDETERLRRKITVYSSVFFVINLIIVIMGFAVWHRDWGPYSVSNCVTLVGFGVGVLLYKQNTQFSMVATAQIYFIYLVALVVIGVPMGLLYLIDMDTRVDEYCLEQDHNCGGRNNDFRDTFLALGYVSTVLAVIAWFAVVTAFARVVFVFVVSVERSFAAPYTSGINPAVLFIATRILPDWHRFGRAVNNAFYTCGEGLRSCCGELAECPVRCCTAFCSSKYACLYGMLVYFVLWIIVLVLCDSSSSGAAQNFWCLLSEIMEIFLYVFVAAADGDY